MTYTRNVALVLCHSFFSFLMEGKIFFSEFYCFWSPFCPKNQDLLTTLENIHVHVAMYVVAILTLITYNTFTTVSISLI